jgi:hypothetical protein
MDNHCGFVHNEKYLLYEFSKAKLVLVTYPACTEVPMTERSLKIHRRTYKGLYLAGSNQVISYAGSWRLIP